MSYEKRSNVNWNKWAAIGSLLSGIAIVFLAVQTVYTHQQVEQTNSALLAQEEQLRLAQEDMIEHSRAWVGSSGHNILGITLTDGTFIDWDTFQNKAKNNCTYVNETEGDNMTVDVTIKNYGSLPAKFFWRYGEGTDKISTQTDLVNSKFGHLVELMPEQDSFLRFSFDYDDYKKMACEKNQHIYFDIAVGYNYTNYQRSLVKLNIYNSTTFETEQKLSQGYFEDFEEIQNDGIFIINQKAY